MGAPQRAFRARLPPIFTLCSFKIDVFLRVFLIEHENLLPQNPCFMRGFRQFSSHRTKCHACHGICTLSPLDAALPMRFAINTQHDTSKVLRPATKNDDGHVQSAAPATKKCNTSSENVAKVLRLPHKTTFDTLQNTSECQEVPRLPRETKQRNVGNLQK